jgi:RimJ/RimL family protein N-acetyltransferase
MNFANFFHNPDLTLALASEDDVQALKALINHAFAYQDEAKGDVRIDEAGIAKKMQSSDLYVWKKHGAIIGCCYVDSLSDRVHFGLLCIADSYRGTGLAQEIISSIEKYALARGNKIVELDYMSLSPWLKQYYEKLGFIETGEREDIGWCELVRMHKHL